MAKGRIVIAPNGQVSIFVEEGTLQSAKPLIERTYAMLKASGIEFSSIGVVEQHRHDTDNKEGVHEHN